MVAGNVHLIVAVEQWLPWLKILEGPDKKLELKGPMREILDHMSTRIGFNYTLKQPFDRKWGSKNKDNNYTGMMGMLERKEADLALGPFATTEERFEVAHFSPPIYLDSIAILSRQSISKGRAFNLMNIFTLELWIAIIFTLMAVCFVAFLLRIFTIPKYSISRTIVQLYSSLLGQSIRLPRQSHLKLLFGFWLSFALLILICFNCQIQSSLVTLTANNIQNFNDLINTDMIPIIESGGTIEAIIEHGSDPTSIGVRQRLNSNPDTRLTYRDLQSEPTLIKVYRRSHVIVTESSTVRSILSIQAKRDRVDANNDQEVDCDFHVSKEAFNFFILAMAVRKDLDINLRREMRNKTAMIMESGVVIHWLKTFTTNATECLTRADERVANRGKNDPIPLKAFHSTFVLWVVGMFVSIMGFVAERCRLPFRLNKVEVARRKTSNSESDSRCKSAISCTSVLSPDFEIQHAKTPFVSKQN